MTENDKPDIVGLEDEEVVGAREACSFLGGRLTPISMATLYRGIAEGRFPQPLKVGRSNRFSMGELRESRRKMLAVRKPVIKGSAQ